GGHEMSTPDYTSDPSRYIAGPQPRPVPGTLNHLFYDSVERYDKPDALQFKQDGRYRPISHREIADRVRRVGCGLQHKGFRPGDRVALLSENRPEWAIADYACLTSGLVDVPIYPGLPATEIQPLLLDSGVVAAFVSTAPQAAKVA